MRVLKNLKIFRAVIIVILKVKLNVLFFFKKNFLIYLKVSYRERKKEVITLQISTTAEVEPG